MEIKNLARRQHKKTTLLKKEGSLFNGPKSKEGLSFLREKHHGGSGGGKTSGQ